MHSDSRYWSTHIFYLAILMPYKNRACSEFRENSNSSVISTQSAASLMGAIVIRMQHKMYSYMNALLTSLIIQEQKFNMSPQEGRRGGERGLGIAECRLFRQNWKTLNASPNTWKHVEQISSISFFARIIWIVCNNRLHTYAHASHTGVQSRSR